MIQTLIDYICDGDKANTNGFNRLLRRAISTRLLNRLMEISE